MSIGLDMGWRRKTIKLANFKKDGLLLDLATGTGDMILAAQKILPESKFIGLDFCEPFLEIARTKIGNEQNVKWIQGDALYLPFEDNSFDGVFTAFALRNVVDVGQLFGELYRIVKPGGKIASLEMVKQANPVYRKIFSFYFAYIIPKLGKWFTSHPDAYSYLPTSIQNFYTANELTSLIKSIGWIKLKYKSVMFRNVAIHIAEKL